ncbi:hypothetical protein O181_007596 [Austropuccinia psidii MF-1]|uniref:Reverse transcriptase RNase H-like domain-containing protein n=1 Tax=Austropuccinia psidii MF-1 TaxID=1389203 RepID=A0A9Q3BL39_9BASI|nr:hypothetical protein [Austropuccinia psidii MF-1]
MSLLGFASYYRQNLQDFEIHARSLYRICDHKRLFQVTQEMIQEYEKINYALTNAPLVLIPNLKLLLNLYIDACGEGLGESLNQVQIVNEKPYDGQVCFILRQIRPTVARYGESQMECLCLVWALEKLHYYIDGSVFGVITDCNSLKSLLNMKTLNRHMLRWQIDIQEFRGNMTILDKAKNIQNNANGLSRWALPNKPENSANAEPQIPIEGSNTTDLETELFEEVRESYKKDNNLNILTFLLEKIAKIQIWIIL